MHNLKMGWFKRSKEGITTSTKEKREKPLKDCGKSVRTARQFSQLRKISKENYYVCDRCSHHERVGSQ